MRTAAWTESVSVLDRLTAIFDAFGDDGEGLGVTELARRANLPKSTVSRVSADLVAQGFLDRVDGLLYLGIRLFEFGQDVDPAQRYRRLALPAMTKLRQSTGHHVHLALPDGHDVVVIANVSGDDPRHAVPRIGARLPAAETALGSAIRAFSRAPADGLERVRESGVATAYETFHDEHICVAAPVLAHGSAVAAVSVSGMLDALDPVAVAPLVRQTAAAVTRALSTPHA